MRVSLPVRRPQPPPTLLELVIGRRRVKLLRRRVGLLAMGAGWTLLKPQPRRWRPGALYGTGIVSLLTVLLVVAVR